MEHVRQIASALQAEYPKCSPTAVSLACRTRETGVEFCERAKEIVNYVTAGEEIKPRRRDTHRLTYAFRCRASRSFYNRVTEALKQSKYPNKQALIYGLLNDWLRENENAPE